MTVGSAKEWMDNLVSYYRDFGVNAFIYWPGVDDDEEGELEQIKLFAERAILMVREST